MVINLMRYLPLCFLLIALNTASAGSVRKQVRASEVDPEAGSYPDIGFVLEDESGAPADMEYSSRNPDVKSNGKLVIWLMGNNSQLADILGKEGYHYIGVHYARQWFSKILRETPTDENARGNVRLEASIGEDVSPDVDIAFRDSIKGRTIALVNWLSKNDRGGKWRSFLTTDRKDIKWDRVVLTGSSHGATTAARFAKAQEVERVVSFAGPRDHFQVWQALPSATPNNRYFGFSHTLDGGWKENHYPRSWKMMGLEEFGPITDVDKVEAPYGNSRMLITSMDVGEDIKRAHNAVQPGSRAFKDEDGNYIHMPVWKYMFTTRIK